MLFEDNSALSMYEDDGDENMDYGDGSDDKEEKEEEDEGGAYEDDM